MPSITEKTPEPISIRVVKLLTFKIGSDMGPLLNDFFALEYREELQVASCKSCLLYLSGIYCILYPKKATIMLTILSLFGRSPFAPLKSHMEKVGTCVHQIPLLFAALEKKDMKELERIAALISEYEHQADLMKNDIRNHLPKSLFLPIDRSHLLEILAIQDNIADAAEDVAVLLTLKTMEMLPSFKSDFIAFLNKNIESFDGTLLIIKEMHELLESSFGGLEAEKVKSMVDEVAFKEHEADLIQRKLLKSLFKAENEMSYGTFHLWQKIFEAVASISNLSEKLAYRVRMTLELK